MRARKTRARRPMREQGLLGAHRSGPARSPLPHDDTIISAAPDLLCVTDLTATLTVREGEASVFVCVDHCTHKLLRVHVARNATRWETLGPAKQAAREVFGAARKDVAPSPVLRHDQGSQDVADDFQSVIAFLGIASSPSFVRALEGNSCAEHITRTLERQLPWRKSFGTIEELHAPLRAWQKLYNEQWIIERHGHRSPGQAHRDHVATVRRTASLIYPQSRVQEIAGGTAPPIRSAAPG